MEIEGRRVNIRESVLTLAYFMKKYPQGFNYEDYQVGKSILSIYQNQDFNIQSLETRERLKESYLKICEDLSTGARGVRNGYMGLQFYENKLIEFETDFENPPLGTIVFRVALQKLVAFNAWKSEVVDEISQHETNCSIYYLASKIKDFV